MKSTVAKPATNRKALNGLRGSLVLRNRQWVRQVNLRYLRRIVQWFLQHELVTRQFELGIHLVGTSAITRLNRVYLGHFGSTDVITFDYHDPGRADWLLGDLFISVPDAVLQAAQFRTSWQSEVIRYTVHGILHLCGEDDRNGTARRQMKKLENRFMRRLGVVFDFNLLARNLKRRVQSASRERRKGATDPDLASSRASLRGESQAHVRRQLTV